jgi:hypothetical protein
MAYLRWSGSPWYAFSHVDGGDGDDVVFTWSVELDGIGRRYPPPRVSREIRELVQARALRVLRGEEVCPQQDASERERIAAACEWPALRASGTEGRGA